MKYNRREFIKGVGLLSGGLLLVPSCTLLSSEKSNYRIFTSQEGACLIALCERLIPADEYLGASDAGVIHFIDKQLKLRFQDEQELFKGGIESLQNYCQKEHESLFEELRVEQQIGIMQLMEEENLPAEYWNVGQRNFFNKLLSRTMQGFYGSPRHGGNKDYVSYKMMKLDYPLLIGQNRYRNL